MSKAKGAGGGGSKGGGGRGGGVHTTKNPDGGGWANQVGGDVVSTHRTKEPAVEKGRKIAIEKKTEHVIHNGDRRIAQKKNSYRKDPNPPKDKK